MKKVWIAICIAAIVVALFVFLSWKVALAIVAGAMFSLLIFAIIMLGLKSWLELEKKDPEKAKKLWFDAMCEIEASRYRYML